MSIHADSRDPGSRSPLSAGALFNLFVIGLTAFLTVVDLFATQAILPTLALHYGVSPSAMGVAVNATTLGMAASGIGVALFSQSINRRLGIAVSLFLLAIPTALLAHAPDLATFAALRVCQGLLMSAAFSLTLAHLGERCTAVASASAFAAYVTGNVASNLVGRLVAATAVDMVGLASNFYLFAGLNLLGGVLVMATISRAKPMPGHETMAASPFATVAAHLANPALQRAFLIGFLILFAFIGTFTYVNFVLVRPPLALDMKGLALVYFVFAPAILTTPLAGAMVARYGARMAIWCGLGLALLGLPLLLAGGLAAMVAGLVLVACGTFFAQATATGFVSRAAAADRGSASGLYLASYFLGGLAGSALLGLLFERFGWPACVVGIAVALIAAMLLATGLSPRATVQPAATRPGGRHNQSPVASH
ncbi:MAG: MFS transporter [Caulobacteraceae bacterium]|nr:MFS transporter [Caulobacteraceae bacterium]